MKLERTVEYFTDDFGKYEKTTRPDGSVLWSAFIDGCGHVRNGGQFIVGVDVYKFIDGNIVKQTELSSMHVKNKHKEFFDTIVHLETQGAFVIEIEDKMDDDARFFVVLNKNAHEISCGLFCFLLTIEVLPRREFAVKNLLCSTETFYSFYQKNEDDVEVFLGLIDC